MTAEQLDRLDPLVLALGRKIDAVLEGGSLAELAALADDPLELGQYARDPGRISAEVRAISYGVTARTVEQAIAAARLYLAAAAAGLFTTDRAAELAELVLRSHHLERTIRAH